MRIPKTCRECEKAYKGIGCSAKCRSLQPVRAKITLGRNHWWTYTLTPDEIKLAIHTAKNNNIVAVELAGGEPFLALDLVELALIEAKRAGLYALIDTSASWASTPRVARDVLTRLADLGLRQVRVSYDRYHARFIPSGHIVNACEQAEQLGCKVQILVTEANDAIKQRTLESLRGIRRFIPDGAYGLHNLLPPARVGRGAKLSDSEVTINGVVPVDCAHFKHHLPLVAVFPNGLVSFGCEFANPRLTYRYPVKGNWLADMMEIWNEDQCLQDMWHKGLAEISQYQLLSEQPCGYCFELLPKLYPDKELIDIRAL